MVNHSKILVISFLAAAAAASHASLLTDPNDPRNWQGASVGTFAQLIYGADTLVNRQQVIDNKLLDDSIFDPTGFSAAKMISGAFNSGVSTDLTGTGSYDYFTDGVGLPHGDTIDNTWVQTGGTVGQSVWDLGAPSSFAAVFPTIDHGPLPQEAIEATVYLSNNPADPASWVQASFVRVWLEGFHTNLGIKWDGFTYVVTTPNGGLFRYASVVYGGPGAFQNDGDDEINGILGLRAVPEPASGAIILGGIGLLAARRRRTR